MPAWEAGQYPRFPSTYHDPVDEVFRPEVIDSGDEEGLEESDEGRADLWEGNMRRCDGWIDRSIKQRHILSALVPSILTAMMIRKDHFISVYIFGI